MEERECTLCSNKVHVRFGVTDKKGVFICKHCVGEIADRLTAAGITVENFDELVDLIHSEDA